MLHNKKKVITLNTPGTAFNLSNTVECFEWFESRFFVLAFCSYLSQLLSQNAYQISVLLFKLLTKAFLI